MPLLRAAWQQLSDPCRRHVSLADAVIHLVGCPLFDGVRHGRDDIERESDVRASALRHLVAAMREAQRAPEVLIAASPVGYYGYAGHGDATVDETHPPDGDWWNHDSARIEAAALAATGLGVRTVVPRTGNVLTPDSIARQLAPFRRHTGGWFGAGRGWTPSIHLADIVDLVAWILARPEISGPVNACSPQPVRSRELAHALRPWTGGRGWQYRPRSPGWAWARSPTSSSGASGWSLPQRAPPGSASPFPTSTLPSPTSSPPSGSLASWSGHDGHNRPPPRDERSGDPEPGHVPATAGPVPARHRGQPLRHRARRPPRRPGRQLLLRGDLGHRLGVTRRPAWLAAHDVLGLALATGAFVNAATTTQQRSKAYTAISTLGALAIIGAAFNGASFLNYGHDFSSLIMAGLWALALTCYLTCLYQAARRSPYRLRGS